MKSDYIIVPEGGVSVPELDAFDPTYWQQRDAIVGQSQGRGVTWFVQADEHQQWVLRHYQRGGLVANYLHDCYWGPRIKRTRVWREMMMLNQLFQQGLPVPAPIAGRVQRLGLGWYRADLITARIPNARPLGQWMNRTELPLNHWQAIGRAIARLHRAGIDHPDLTVQNLLLNNEHKVFILDFDCAVQRKPGGWQHSNIKRLQRSINKWRRKHNTTHFAPAMWQAVLSAYAQKMRA